MSAKITNIGLKGLGGYLIRSIYGKKLYGMKERLPAFKAEKLKQLRLMAREQPYIKPLPV
ncbi:hypothetical protein [Alteribacter populi]|uniref:hypothetical protein n=1 Tax=Alteribacter populi TaxID=2011011 RepID=UPI000BBA4E0C|nr:hypothetical protein [Alteribacter populi]